MSALNGDMPSFHVPGQWLNPPALGISSPVLSASTWLSGVTCVPTSTPAFAVPSAFSSSLDASVSRQTRCISVYPTRAGSNIRPALRKNAPRSGMFVSYGTVGAIDGAESCSEKTIMNGEEGDVERKRIASWC